MPLLVRIRVLILTLVIPEIWTTPGHPLDKPFLKFITLTKSNSNPQYWRRLSDLFEVLRKKSIRSTSELITWVTEGILINASSLVDPNSAFNILVDLILDMEDEGSQFESWKLHFLPELHRFLTQTDAKKSDETKIAQALASALVKINRKRIGHFEQIWNPECKALIGLMPATSMRIVSESHFKEISWRWVDLTLLTLRGFTGGQLEALPSPELTSFLRIVSETFESALSASSKMDGIWVDGAELIASLLRDQLFSGYLLKSDEMTDARKAFMDFVKPRNIVKQLHSPSAVPIIRIIVVFCSVYSKESSEVWETLVSEALPQDRSVDLHNPTSLLAQVVAYIEPVSPPSLKSPEGVNMNLVTEMTAALNRTDNFDAAEEKRREGLFVSLVSLRGTFPITSILTLRRSHFECNGTGTCSKFGVGFGESDFLTSSDMHSRPSVCGIAFVI
jgi:hypothetical protein